MRKREKEREEGREREREREVFVPLLETALHLLGLSLQKSGLCVSVNKRRHIIQYACQSSVLIVILSEGRERIENIIETDRNRRCFASDTQEAYYLYPF
jgi:hypothetical protein